MSMCSEHFTLTTYIYKINNSIKISQYIRSVMLKMNKRFWY